jgi:hypothetical protein
VNGDIPGKSVKSSTHYNTIMFSKSGTKGQLLSTVSVITINVPVVFMARYVMVLRGATSLRGDWKGWALKIETFLGPEMARAKRVPFGPKKVGTCIFCSFYFLCDGRGGEGERQDHIES